MKTTRTRIRMSDVRLSLLVLALAVAVISSSVVAVREGKRSIPAKSPLASTGK